MPVSDINECDNNPCPANSQCVNNDGAYVCNCNTGFVKQGLVCTGKSHIKITARLFIKKSSCDLLFCMLSRVNEIIASDIILCIRPTNKRRRYIVTSSLIGWVHTQNDSWDMAT